MEEVNCKLCGSSEKKIILSNCQDYLENKPGKFTVVQCKRCKLIYLNPRPTAEELTSYYSSDYYAFQKPNLSKIKKRLSRLNRFLFRAILKERFHYPIEQNYSVFTKILTRMAFPFCHSFFRGVLEFKGNGRILDIGCGSGSYLWFLKNLGWEVWGFEISDKASQAAKSLGINISLGDLAQANFPSQYFDVIRMNHVLEHLHSPETYLKRIKRIMTLDAICLIRIPNVRSTNYLIFKKYWYGLDIPRHLYSFRPSTLKALFDRFGFQTKRIHYVASAGTVLGSLSFLFQAKGWKNQPWTRFLLTNKGLRKIIINPFCRLPNIIHLSDEIEAIFKLSPVKPLRQHKYLI